MRRQSGDEFSSGVQGQSPSGGSGDPQVVCLTLEWITVIWLLL